MWRLKGIVWAWSMEAEVWCAEARQQLDAALGHTFDLIDLTKRGAVSAHHPLYTLAVPTAVLTTPHANYTPCSSATNRSCVPLGSPLIVPPYHLWMVTQHL